MVDDGRRSPRTGAGRRVASAPVRVGVALPSMVAGTTRDELLEWMRRIDAGPFSVLGCGERVTYPNLDMMSTLAVAAGVTDRVAIEATVSVLPMHSAVHVAKQAATIDVLSGGRFVLGVGVGGRDDDYRAYEAPTARKHARLDEQVACIRRVWRGDAPFEGGAPVGPAPVQPGGPRILTGSMGPKSMARAAVWADGLAGFDMAGDPSSIDRSFRAFEAAWSAAGRSDRPFLQTSFWFGLGHDASETVRDYAYRYLRIFGEDAARSLSALCTATSPGEVHDRLRAIAGTGADEVILVATTADVDDVERAAEIVAAL
jgi:alkanesulfonate monooxygenase SsuD/methylene tetrahydromethanopterin reductase-like flavin-dependent oxidoreductase (luciferase family)